MTAPRFVAGAVFVGQRFKRAAPILRRHAHRCTRNEFVEYCCKRGWRVKLILGDQRWTLIRVGR